MIRKSGTIENLAKMILLNLLNLVLVSLTSVPEVSMGRILRRLENLRIISGS